MTDKTPTWGYTYDGSSTWSIGPYDDPQADARLTIVDRDDDRAREIAQLICDALNEGRLVIKDTRS
jgi:hypothetical protein